MSEEEKKIFDEANKEARLYGYNECERKTRAAFIKNMRAKGMDEETIEEVLADAAALTKTL